MFRFADPGGRSYAVIGSSATNLIAYWTGISTLAQWSMPASGGRSTGTCLRLTVTNTTAISLNKLLDSQATWGVAFAFKSSAAGAISIIFLSDSSTQQLTFKLNVDGTISAIRGNTATGTTLGTTSSGITYGIWAHIEIKVTIHPSAGAVQIWINGVSKLNLTSQNTRNSANSSANIITLGSDASQSGSQTLDYDDIIFYDGQATDPSGNTGMTGPIGDCGVSWLPPTGAGNSTQFTPDSGSNYARVADTTPDTTSYVESNTLNHIDTYTLTDLPANTVGIKAIAALQYCRKTDVSSRGLKGEIRTASTDFAHPTEFQLSDSYAYNFSNWDLNPNTVAAWTPTEVNNLESGQKVSS